VARGVLASIGFATLTQVPALSYVVGATAVLFFGCVVAPAVFLRNASRRRDARRVLRLVLEAVRPPRLR